MPFNFNHNNDSMDDLKIIGVLLFPKKIVGKQVLTLSNHICDIGCPLDNQVQDLFV